MARNKLMLDVSSEEQQQEPLPQEGIIITLVIIFWTSLFPVSAVAEERLDTMDKKGLVCRRDDLYFSRPYYFIFSDKTVLGPWVTIDTPQRLGSLRETKYHTLSSTISWGSYTLMLDTLRLEFGLRSIKEKIWQCEFMNAEHLALVILQRQRKISR